MNCDEARIMLAAYADGELASIESDAIVTHLEQCGRCRQTVHDQQRVQHVLDSYQPPRVDDDQWNEVGQRLRAELEGKGTPLALKTQPRIEGLEPTPVDQEPLSPEEVPAAPPPPPPARAIPAPAVRPRTAAARLAPAMTTLRVGPRRGRPGFRWVAHMAGALAASLVIALGLATLWVHPQPPIALNTLARQGDVTIMEVEMLDANYNLVMPIGDTGDVAAIWVVPEGPNG